MNTKFAQYGMLSIFFLSIVFHGLVLISVIDFRMVWGGRLKNAEEMYLFESVSIAINLIFLLFMLIHAGFLKLKVSTRLMKIVLWIMLILFALNTLGNLLSESTMEKIIFTPVTILLTLFSFILVRAK